MEHPTSFRQRNRARRVGVRPQWRFLGLLLAVLTVQNGAQSQDAYGCIDGMSDDAVSYRIRKIERMLEDGRSKSRGWRIGWIGGFTILGSLQTVLAVNAARDDKDWDRFAFAYAAAGAWALTVGLSVVPMPGVWGSKRLRRKPEETAEQRREKLRYATNLLERGASIEKLLGSERPVVVGVVAGVVGGTVKAAKWPGKTRVNTMLTYLAPPAAALATSLTSPRHLREGWEKYRGMACTERYYDGGGYELDLDLSVTPSGVSFSVSF